MVGHPPELADLVFQVGFELDESAGAGVAVAEHEAIDATGIKRREELSHQPTLDKPISVGRSSLAVSMTARMSSHRCSRVGGSLN